MHAYLKKNISPLLLRILLRLRGYLQPQQNPGPSHFGAKLTSPSPPWVRWEGEGEVGGPGPPGIFPPPPTVFSTFSATIEPLRPAPPPPPPKQHRGEPGQPLLPDALALGLLRFLLPPLRVLLLLLLLDRGHAPGRPSPEPAPPPHLLGF